MWLDTAYMAEVSIKVFIVIWIRITMNRMGLTVLVGGQYGSEGKGKISGYLAREFQMAIRTGGPNAGHSLEYGGKIYAMRSVPCAFVNPSCLLGIGAGAVIDIDVLKKEIETTSLRPGRLIIDPHVGVIEQRHRSAEEELGKRIGSTKEGVGAAMSDRVLRKEDFKMVRDYPELKEWLGDVSGRANDIIDKGGNVFLEGTQGFGLSLYGGPFPFTTSRDTTPAAFCSEAGLSPRLVNQIIMVIRTFPIRVGGNSGPMNSEMTWEEVERRMGASIDEREKITTVTKRLRRVSEFDYSEVARAAMVMRPTQVAVNFVDYINLKDHGKRKFDDLSDESKKFISKVEEETKTPVTLIGTGPMSADIIDLRKEKLGI